MRACTPVDAMIADQEVDADTEPVAELDGFGSGVGERAHAFDAGGEDDHGRSLRGEKRTGSSAISGVRRRRRRHSGLSHAAASHQPMMSLPLSVTASPERSRQGACGRKTGW